MIQAPKRPEIDQRTIKLIVGIIAISLAFLTDHFAHTAITSISASYYDIGWSQSIFIGFLFAIASFLFSYNGRWRAEMILSKVAAVAGLGVALFPCRCGDHAAVVPYVHEVSAAVMFLILVVFCYIFFVRARDKKYTQATARATIYALCGIAILSSILVLAFDHFSGKVLSTMVPRLTFYGEAIGLMAFGISWLTASRVLPVLTRRRTVFTA